MNAPYLTGALFLAGIDDQQPSPPSSGDTPTASPPDMPDTVPTAGSILEDPAHQHPPRVSPLDTLKKPGDTITVPIDIHTYIDTIVSPNHVQINSLQRIPPNLLQPFARGHKDVILISVQNQLVMRATLESIHDTSLFVQTDHSTALRKPGETLLMLIPALPHQRYVLQLIVEKVYAHRLMLRYQDPRYDERRYVQVTAPVSLRMLPTTLLPALRQQQVGIMRHLIYPPEGPQRNLPVRLEDQLYDLETPNPSPCMEQRERTSVLTCSLQDISLGGTCVILPGESQSQELLHRLVSLRLSLPACTDNLNGKAYLPVTLDLLSVIRGVGGSTPPFTLHIRFLKRLPEAFAPYFVALEGMSQQTVLALARK